MKERKENESLQMKRSKVVRLYMILFISIAFLLTALYLGDVMGDSMLTTILQMVFVFVAIATVVGGIMELSNMPKLSKRITEKVKQIANSNAYTPIQYRGMENMIIFLYGNALKELNCTLAAKLDEKGNVYYAVVDENGKVIGKECKQRKQTFLIRNFEKI